MHRFISRTVLSILLLAATANAATAEWVQRATCAAVSGRGYTGGCPQMEGHSVTIDAPEDNFPDSGIACQAANALATQHLTAQLRGSDRANPNSFNFCSRLTIRCVPSCGQVKK